jgi:hypothetical protein
MSAGNPGKHVTFNIPPPQPPINISAPQVTPGRTVTRLREQLQEQLAIRREKQKPLDTPSVENLNRALKELDPNPAKHDADFNHRQAPPIPCQPPSLSRVVECESSYQCRFCGLRLFVEQSNNEITIFGFGHQLQLTPEGHTFSTRGCSGNPTK